MDKQMEVLGSGLMAGIGQYQHDERERDWGRLIGTVQGTCERLQGLAKIADFGVACFLGDNERAKKMGDVLRKLNFDKTTPEGLALARDEVFADTYAHATGFPTKIEWSMLI